ncbi:hypothetical protein [Aeromicrobium sp. 179-A 4D2 NHS]|uniref:hypothetical protein n=1 Tax=Aeromicrobium sp. 179-A 4D2 NHS TaxID=3142375 RepID=UPI0039A36E42
MSVRRSSNYTPERIAHASPDERLEAATDPHTPFEILHALAQLPGSHNARVRGAVVAHPSLSVETLVFMADDEETSIRRTVAGHLNTPTDVVNRLAFDVDQSVRTFALSNPNIDPGVLRVCVSDPTVEVAIAKNPETPGDVLVTLAGSARAEVRLLVAKHDNLNDDVFNILVNDSDVKVINALHVP